MIKVIPARDFLHRFANIGAPEFGKTHSYFRLSGHHLNTLYL